MKSGEPDQFPALFATLDWDPTLDWNVTLDGGAMLGAA